MQKKLELVFATAAGDKKMLSVTNPREDVNKEQADQAMQAVIAANAFGQAGAALKAPVEARIRTTDVTILE